VRVKKWKEDEKQVTAIKKEEKRKEALEKIEEHDFILLTD